MKLNNLFVLAALAITGSAQGMTKTAEQVESKVQSAEKQEPKMTLRLLFKKAEIERLEKVETDFSEKMIKKIMAIEDAGLRKVTYDCLKIFALQVRNLARRAAGDNSVSEKAKYEQRMYYLMACSDLLLENPDKQELQTIARALNRCIANDVKSPRELEGLWQFLVESKIFCTKQDRKDLTDAFYGYSTMLGFVLLK